MGWRSVLRAMERAGRQAQKDKARLQKEADKSKLMAFSAQAVTDVDEHIYNLLSTHHSDKPLIDWTQVTTNTQPVLSIKYQEAAHRAALAIEDFKPSIFYILQGGSRSKLKRLKKAHQLAIHNSETASQNFMRESADWKEKVASIERALKGEAAALKALLQNIENLSDDCRIGRYVSFDVNDNYVHAKPVVHSSDIVPRIRRKQLASGRLSETKMPDAQFYEIYQDYVCSVAFRIGAELFNTVPLKTVFVTCHTHMLDASTGHIEETAILSVQFMRETFERLNLNNIDPSDALKNFRHNMQFKRSKGFGRIEPL